MLEWWGCGVVPAVIGSGRAFPWVVCSSTSWRLLVAGRWVRMAEVRTIARVWCGVVDLRVVGRRVETKVGRSMDAGGRMPGRWAAVVVSGLLQRLSNVGMEQ